MHAMQMDVRDRMMKSAGRAAHIMEEARGWRAMQYVGRAALAAITTTTVTDEHSIQ